MNDKVFLDTNILVYAYSNSEPDKSAIARHLISESNSFISTQVLQELCNTVTKKYKFSFDDGAKTVKENCQNNNIHINTSNTILKACEIANRYRFSFYDSLIVAAAIESNCSIIYSEDLSHGQLIDGEIKIVSPFL